MVILQTWFGIHSEMDENTKGLALTQEICGVWSKHSEFSLNITNCGAESFRTNPKRRFALETFFGHGPDILSSYPRSILNLVQKFSDCSLQILWVWFKQVYAFYKAGNVCISLCKPDFPTKSEGQSGKFVALLKWSLNFHESC